MYKCNQTLRITCKFGAEGKAPQLKTTSFCQRLLRMCDLTVAREAQCDETPASVSTAATSNAKSEQWIAFQSCLPTLPTVHLSHYQMCAASSAATTRLTVVFTWRFSRHAGLRSARREKCSPPECLLYLQLPPTRHTHTYTHTHTHSPTHSSYMRLLIDTYRHP